MGAPELLSHLRGAGLALSLAPDGRLHVAPRSALTDELRAAIRAERDALALALAGERDPAPAHPAPARPPAGVDTRPYRLSQAEADAAHAQPWDDAAIGLFVARVSLFLRRGISASDADDLAERLHLRDVQKDVRRLCLECAHLSGRPALDRRLTGGRCRNHRAADAWHDALGELATRLQRCPAFTELAPAAGSTS